MRKSIWVIISVLVAMLLLASIALAQKLTAKDTAINELQVYKENITKSIYQYTLDEAICSLGFDTENVTECKQCYHINGETTKWCIVVNESKAKVIDADLDRRIQKQIIGLKKLNIITYKP